MDDKEKRGLLKSVYEQNWLHARHVENERLWFTNIYVIAVAGLLAYTFRKGEATFWPWPILVISSIFSLAGFLMSHSLVIPFLHHSRTANSIQIKEWQLNYSSLLPRGKFVSFSAVFHWLYILMFSTSVGFLVYDLLYDWARYKWWMASAAGLVCLGVFSGIYKFIFKKKESETLQIFSSSTNR